jgi:CubicO group peptidase (beta-lactamase class C family)
MKTPCLRSARPGLLFVALVALTAVSTRAATETPPEKLGFSSERLGRLDRAIQEQIDQHRLAGMVTYISRDGQPVRFRSYGFQDIEANQPMRTDAIFRIASMS